jgi:hypothetical protein
MYSDLYVCHFYVTQNTKYLNMISCKFVGQIAVCIQIFLLFLNSEIWFLIFFKSRITSVHMYQIFTRKNGEIKLNKRSVRRTYR